MSKTKELPIVGYATGSAGYNFKYGNWVLTQITPELAKEWLANSKDVVRNRNITASRVSSYADQMLSGQWRVTHQGIAFDENNHLTDGQHRLSAIVKAGERNQSIKVEMWVYWGLPQTDMIVVDKHRPRSEQNSLYISGMDVSRSDVITARAMLGHGNYNMSGNCTRLLGEDLANYINQHREAISFSCRLMCRNEKGISTAPIRALIGRAWYTQDRDRITQFVNILYTGMVENPKEDEGAIRLRNWLKDQPANISQSVTVYRRATSALVAFLERRSLAALRETADEQFPIPGE